jgi:hypothetical protein
MTDQPTLDNPVSGNPEPIVGYCRACGKPLAAAQVRKALGTIYCAEHAPEGAPPPPLPNDPFPSPYAAAGPAPYAALSPGSVNPDISPGLAFFLGLIPGVGAIYNGQYAKGLVHALITGTLIATANQAGDGEALVVMCLLAFFAYMAFESSHTARRRRDGLPVDEFSSMLSANGSRRSFAGPLALIGIGVFFLLSNLELISIRQLVRWWPVGLIVFGCYLLYLRVAGPKDRAAGEEAREQ